MMAEDGGFGSALGSGTFFLLKIGRGRGRGVAVDIGADMDVDASENDACRGRVDEILNFREAEPPLPEYFTVVDPFFFFLFSWGLSFSDSSVWVSA